MDKQAVIDFFDTMAPGWDAGMERNDAVIREILDNADIREGLDVLDVACGTGVLFPDYLARKVGSLTAVDISQEMVARAREKFPEAEVCCADVENWQPDRQFDRIVVYNALPHFPDPGHLISVLAGFLKPGGILTVAHGSARAVIDAGHKGRAAGVSMGLIHEDELAELFGRVLTVTTKISDDRMYQVVGRKE